jgi:hypothetical protein
MNISKSLLGFVTLEYKDEEWNQTIDYEHIPFRFRKCHEHNNLFRNFPVNGPQTNPVIASKKSKDGFTQV